MSEEGGCRVADNRPIGIFDSGLGGLTVVKELIKQLPNEQILYFGDTKRVPYGTKSRETISLFAHQDAAFLLSMDVKMIVAACGTVSSVVEDLPQVLPVPYMGVVENAARAAVAATRNGRIGVLGTEATIASGAHKRAILSILPSATVFTRACSLFVPLVEAGWYRPEDPGVMRIARTYLDDLCKEGLDTLILGCTHYPLLSQVIEGIMGRQVTLINMGTSTAAAVAKRLKVTDSLCDGTKPGKQSLFVSDLTDSFCRTASVLLGQDAQSISVKQVEIDRL